MASIMSLGRLGLPCLTSSWTALSLGEVQFQHKNQNLRKLHPSASSFCWNFLNPELLYLRVVPVVSWRGWCVRETLVIRPTEQASRVVRLRGRFRLPNQVAGKSSCHTLKSQRQHFIRFWSSEIVAVWICVALPRPATVILPLITVGIHRPIASMVKAGGVWVQRPRRRLLISRAIRKLCRFRRWDLDWAEGQSWR